MVNLSMMSSNTISVGVHPTLEIVIVCFFFLFFLFCLCFGCPVFSLVCAVVYVYVSQIAPNAKNTHTKDALS